MLFAAVAPCNASGASRTPFVWTPSDRPREQRTHNGDVVSEVVVLHSKHESEGRLVAPVVARALQTVMEQQRTLAEPMGPDGNPVPVPPIFQTATVPPLSVGEYVQRLADNAYTSPASLLGALILLDRYFRRVPSVRLTDMTCFKLFLTALRVASKSMELRTLNNRHFAPVGGVTNRALNTMEAQMLSDLNFDVVVSPAEFTEYARRLWPAYTPAVVLARPSVPLSG